MEASKNIPTIWHDKLKEMMIAAMSFREIDASM
jgi:hypothetical protein